MLPQILAMVGLVAAGSFLSYWMRRVDMSGFELWLPFGLLIAVAISPLAGFLFAMAIIVASWFLFPFHPQWVAIMGACLAVTFYGTNFFTFTSLNFTTQAMMLIVFYNIVSNMASVFVGIDPLRAVKFFALSTWLSWLIYGGYGWQLVEFFSI